MEIPVLVHDGPSWLIPLSEIIGFKPYKRHTEPTIVSLQIPDRYISDESSSSDSDLDFPRRPSDTDDISVLGYGYYTSPETTPRPTFTTPAIPINAPPRTRLRTGAAAPLSRNTSTDSIAQSTTSRKSTSSHKRRYQRQPHATSEITEFQISSFVAHGRVTNYARVLCYLPRYIRCSSTCYEKLVGSPRGVTRSTKTFIALLAAAQVGCQYFVSYFTAKFLELGGDANWLEGIHAAGEKISRIAALNSKLAERPWELSKRDILRLKEREVTDEGEEEGWTVGEIAQIVAILAMFHAQSSIALGLGVVCEADVFGGTVWRRISKHMESLNLDHGETEGIDTRHGPFMNGTRLFRDELIDKLKMRMFASGHLSPDMSFENLQKLSQHAEMVTKEQERILREAIKDRKLSIPTTIKQQLFSTSLPNPSSSSAKTPTPLQTEFEQPVNPIIEDLSRFLLNQSAPRPDTIPPTQPILSTKKFSWEDALHIIQTHLPDLAGNLDRRIHLPPGPPFLQIPGQNRLDIHPFEDALRNYSLALIGVQRDTYDYRLLDEYLHDSLRLYIRRICLDPRGILKSDWDAVRELGFSNREIVEIGVIVCEARFMGVLLYAFRVMGDIQRGE